MNKRIRELAEQAGIVFWEMSGDVDWRQANKEMLGEFAELIVQECLRMIENEAAQYSEPVWAIELVNDIKEHFGVEEK